MSILDQIFAHKRLEVAAARQRLPAAELADQAHQMPPGPDFVAALRSSDTVLAPDKMQPTARRTPALIAEVKHRSPSKGLLRPDFDPLALAQTYAAHGAAAISVLTDERYFGGRLAYLQQIAALGTSLPLLRKDFIFDSYQLLEARAAGASAVLLIVAMLSDGQLADLLGAASELELACLVETHTLAEVVRALAAGAAVIGVNNRDLHTFEVRLETSLALRAAIPAEVVMVAESGIQTRAEVERLAAAGVDAILVGEGLVKAQDVGGRIRELLNGAGERLPAPSLSKLEE